MLWRTGEIVSKDFPEFLSVHQFTIFQNFESGETVFRSISSRAWKRRTAAGQHFMQYGSYSPVPPFWTVLQCQTVVPHPPVQGLGIVIFGNFILPSMGRLWLGCLTNVEILSNPSSWWGHRVGDPLLRLSQLYTRNLPESRKNQLNHVWSNLQEMIEMNLVV